MSKAGMLSLLATPFVILSACAAPIAITPTAYPTNTPANTPTPTMAPSATPVPTPTPNPAEPLNLIVNGSFEEGVTGWDYTDATDELVADAVEGNQAYKLLVGGRDQQVNIQPGKPYMLTFFAKISGDPDPNVVGVNFWTGKPYSGGALQEGKCQWAEVHSTEYLQYRLIFTAPDGWDEATVVIYKDAGRGALLVDKVQLFEVTDDMLKAASPTPTAAPVVARSPKTIAPAGSIRPPYLILMPQPITPQYTGIANIVKNIRHIESLPFDGIVIDTNAGWHVMRPGSLSYEEIYAEFAPLKGLFQRMEQNYLTIFVDRPGDLFDDEAWALALQNIANLARAAQAVGITHITYDNEEYQQPLLAWPEGAARSDKTLAEYQEQARLRGRQLMEAIVSEIPNVTVLTYHGPYVTDCNLPAWFVRKQFGCLPLHGPFFLGMMEGKGPQATLLDGGEIYQYRTEGDFEDSLQFRKYELVDDAEQNNWIPAALKANWADQLGFAFGVYNYEWQPEWPMSAAIMRTTLENALRSGAHTVWYYTEPGGEEWGENWYVPGGVSQAWLDAVRGAYQAVHAELLGPNLVYNSGFEFGEMSWDDWGYTEIVTEQYVDGVSQPAGYSNPAALRLDGGPNEAGRGQVLTNLEFGKTYRLSGWGRVTDPADTITIGIWFQDANKNDLADLYIEINTTEYTQKSLTFSMPEGTAMARVYAWREGGGKAEAYVDDILIREIP